MIDLLNDWFQYDLTCPLINAFLKCCAEAKDTIWFQVLKPPNIRPSSANIFNYSSFPTTIKTMSFALDSFSIVINNKNDTISDI